MIMVSAFSLFIFSGICTVAGWIFGSSWARDNPPKGTQPLYGDHLKVCDIRRLLRNVEQQNELTTPGLIVEKIRLIIGDAFYNQF